MAIGTPFAKSPIYNRDGYLRFTDNRLRGFQAGISGSPLQGALLQASDGLPLLMGHADAPRSRKAAFHFRHARRMLRVP